MLTWLNNIYEGKILPWFRNSESILIARLTDLVGIVTAVSSVTDWSAILSLDFNAFDLKQAIVGGLIILHGIIAEAGRRYKSDI